MFSQYLRVFVRPLVLAFPFQIALLTPLTGAWAQTSHHKGISLVKATGRTLSQRTLSGIEKTATHGSVSSDKRTLTFMETAITLIVHTGPDDDMLSYRIAGLKSPTLLVPRGSTLNVLFVNEDGDMKHDLRFTDKQAPFPAEPDRKVSVGSPPLAPQAKGVRHAEQMVLRTASPGTYTYLCTVKGHASGGMFGTIVVR